MFDLVDRRGLGVGLGSGDILIYPAIYRVALG